MSRRSRLVAAAAASVCVTLLAFAPLVRHLGSSVPYRPADESSSARNYWAASAVGKTPFTLVRDTQLDAPEGQAVAPAVQIANALQPTFVLAAHHGTSWLGAFNLFVLAGFAASLFATFALLDSLGLRPLASATGAVGFSSSQWAVEQILYGHVAFAQLWVLPLLLGTLVWARHGRPVRAVAPGLALALSFYAFSYLGLFGCGLVGAALLTALAGHRLRLGADDLRRAAWGAAAALVAMLPVGLAPRIAPSSALNLPAGTRHDLNGAQLRDYLIPSSRHILYGRLVHGHLGETVVFFGFTLIVVGLVGAIIVLREWRHAPLAARVAVVLIPVGVWGSLPAYLRIVGHDVPVPDPAYAIGTVVQWWRIYTRFAVLAGLGLAILSAFALDRLIRRHGARGIVLAALLAGLVVVEAVPAMPFPTTRLLPSAADRWLAARPGGVVAFYPSLLPAAHVASSQVADDYIWGTLYDQVYFHHPLFTLPQLQPLPEVATEARFLATRLADPRTARVLAAEHVRYVVVRRDIYARLALGRPRPSAGLRLAARFGETEIYRVVAAPIDVRAQIAHRAVELARAYAYGSASVSLGRGFYGEEEHLGFHARWLGGTGTIVVRPLRPEPFVTFRLTLQGFSHLIPRVLIVESHGREIAKLAVPTNEAVVSALIRLPAAANTLTLQALPGPTVLGKGDDRDVSVYVESVTADPVRVDAAG